MKLIWRKCASVGFLAVSLFSTLVDGAPPLFVTHSGVVVDSSTNTPIAGAKVFSTTFVDLATTGENGAFSFNLPLFGPASKIWHLSVFAQGYGLFNWPLALTSLAADSIVKLSHYEYASLQCGVRGTVQDRSSSLPVFGCDVALFTYDSVWVACNSSLGAYVSCNNSNLGGGLNSGSSENGGWWSIREAFVSQQKTDSLGRFAFLAVPGTRYTLKFRTPEYAPTLILTEPAGIATPETRSIFLTRETANVSGVITDTLTGKPIGAVLLELRQAAYRASDSITPFGYYIRDTLITKTDGAFTFTGLLCGEHYSLHTVVQGYYDDSISVPQPTGCKTAPPPTVVANLALTPSMGSVGGFVRDLHSNWPIDSATVYLYAKMFVKKGTLWAMDDTLIDSTVSDHTGAYTFTGLPENLDYTLYAIASLYHLSDDVAFQTTGGSLTAATLLPGLQFGVEGAINDSSSSLPIKGAQVTVFARRRGVGVSFENVPLDSGFTDSTGFFSFPLPPTDAFTTGYLVTAQAAGFAQKSIPISAIDTIGPSVAGADFFLVAGNAPVLFHARYADNTLPPQIERNSKGVFVTTSRSVRVQLYDLRGVCLADLTVMPGKTLLLKSSSGGRLCVAKVTGPGVHARTFKMMVLP